MKRKFRLCIFAFLAIAGMLLSLAACGKPSDQTVYLFADVDFVDGSVGVPDTVALRPLNAAELERVKGFLQDLELHQAEADEKDANNRIRCGFRLCDAQGTQYFISCGINRQSVAVLYYTHRIEDGARINIEYNEYYIDEADMQAFEVLCSELLEAQPQTLQPFAEAEIVGVEWYKGPSKHSPVEGEDLETLRLLFEELVIETAMQPSELYAGTTRYYLTLAEGKIVWISTPGHEDKIWIDNVFYTCKTPALIEKLGEIAQVKFEESYVEP